MKGWAMTIPASSPVSMGIISPPKLSSDHKHVEFDGRTFEVVFRKADGREAVINDEQTLNEIIAILNTTNIQASNVDLGKTVLTKDGLKDATGSSTVRLYTSKLAGRVDSLFKAVIQIHFKETLPKNKHRLKTDFNPATEFPPLGNIGNSCYLDSTLWLLLSVKNFIKQRMDQIKAEDLKEERQQLLFQYLRDFIEAVDSKNIAGIVQAQKNIYEVLPMFTEFKKRWGQQDAPALLTHILEVMRFELTAEITREGVPLQDPTTKFVTKNTDPITIVKANLNFPTGNLSEILAASSEAIIKDDQKVRIHDAECKSVTQTTKLTLQECEEPSDVIFIQLERSLQGKKNTAQIDLPKDGSTLDLKGIFDVRSDETRSFVYEVVGIVNHYGTKDGGHYTAKVKHETSGKWHDCNDSAKKNKVVEGLTHDDGKAVYMLALKRVKPRL